MNKLQKTIASTLAAGAMLANTVLPVFAGTTSLVITGNGAETDNDIVTNVTSTTTVTQSNTAIISNTVNADSDTGGNDADKNTGGSVSIKTGDATTVVSIENEANKNILEVDGCCQVDASVEISGNGWKSDNDAKLNLTTDTSVWQDNFAKIKNTVYADSDTGKNDADKNTGGDVSIETGDASTTVLIDNMANFNSARIGSGSGAGSVSLKILDNGAETDNDIVLKLNRSLGLTQWNFAKISNKVDADADTGKNDANKNTGGSVSIETGDALVGVGIDNLANFNYADLNCGCLLGITAKIAGNGWDSDNTIRATLIDAKEVFQTNDYLCGFGFFPYGGDFQTEGYGGYFGHKPCNDVKADADTGKNDADKNTGDPVGDPSIETGDAATLVDLSTSANGNVLVENSLPFPELPGIPDFDWDFDMGFNWAFFWAWFSGMFS